MRGGNFSRPTCYMHYGCDVEIYRRKRLARRALCSPLPVLRLLCMGGASFLLFNLHVLIIAALSCGRDVLELPVYWAKLQIRAALLLQLLYSCYCPVHFLLDLKSLRNKTPRPGKR